jgi:UDP-glucose 4-epimerase
VVDALWRAGSIAGLAGSTFNIGSGRETSVMEVVRILEQVTGRHANVVAFPEHTGGVERLCADVRRAARTLGWTPQITLEKGLAALAGAAPEQSSPLESALQPAES